MRHSIIIVCCALAVLFAIGVRMYTVHMFGAEHNPAFKNCIDLGGVITQHPLGIDAAYSACVFGKGHECEVWSLYNRRCSFEYHDTTTGLSAAAQYCIRTGGEYLQATKECKFFDTFVCPVNQYYLQQCD